MQISQSELHLKNYDYSKSVTSVCQFFTNVGLASIRVRVISGLRVPNRPFARTPVTHAQQVEPVSHP